MDGKSHDEGRLGGPVGINTDIDSYMEGRRSAESNTGVPGAAFTILIVAPLLFLVYPVLGLTINVIFAGVFYLLSLTELPIGLIILIGLILGIAGFYPAFKLEAIASQFMPYRFLRAFLRPISGFCITIALRTGAAFNHFRGFDIHKVPGDKLLEGVLVAVFFHFAFRRGDRTYFPVWAQVRKQQERVAKGIPDQRPFLKRFIYSLCWFIPVMIVLHVIVLAFVTAISDGDQEIAEFYQRFSIFIYIFDFSVWFILAFAGVLPGSAKIRKHGVGQSVES